MIRDSEGSSVIVHRQPLLGIDDVFARTPSLKDYGVIAVTEDLSQRMTPLRPFSNGLCGFLGDHPKAAIDDQVKSGHREKA
jgi:hypothetical protein